MDDPGVFLELRHCRAGFLVCGLSQQGAHFGLQLADIYSHGTKINIYIGINKYMAWQQEGGFRRGTRHCGNLIKTWS